MKTTQHERQVAGKGAPGFGPPALGRSREQPAVGILLFETAGEKLPGDPGFPGTYRFPVAYGRAGGSFQALAEGSASVQKNLLEAAKGLERQGVRAIVGDCGLMGLYQEALAASVGVPVLASSLELLPLLLASVGAGRRLGIVTGDDTLLSRRHMPKGCPPERLLIRGMQGRPHFRAVVLERREPPEYGRLRSEVLSVAQGLAAPGDVGAILLECSNLAPFRREVAQACGLPVFDINAAVQFLYEALP